MQAMLAAILPAIGATQVLLWAGRTQDAAHVARLAAALAQVEQASLAGLAATAVTRARCTGRRSGGQLSPGGAGAAGTH